MRLVNPAPASEDASAAVADVKANCTGAKELYVSPDGNAQNNGSIEHPLDLATALSATSPAVACDTIWLHGGTYRGPFTSALRGREGAPIVVREAPGQRATIDSAPEPTPALTVNGQYVWFWGFEITNSDPQRVSADTTSWPADLKRGSGVVARGTHLKFINMVVHDMTRGFEIGADAIDVEVYGSLIFYNGWKNAQQVGNGSAIDTHNRTGTRRVADSIIFDQFGSGFSAYSSAPEVNIKLEGNILFNNGSLSKAFGRDILIGGGGAQAPALLGNMAYGEGQIYIGYGAGCTNARIEDNYFAGTVPLVLAQCDGAVKGNTLFGNVGPLATAHPDNTFVPGKQVGLVIRTRRNEYEPGRANIGVYNWDKKTDLDLDLSGIGLEATDEYEIRDAKNFFGQPLAKGVAGKTPRAMVSLANLTVAKPTGQGLVTPPHTAPEFLALVVIPIHPKPAAPPS